MEYNYDTMLLPCERYIYFLYCMVLYDTYRVTYNTNIKEKTSTMKQGSIQKEGTNVVQFICFPVTYCQLLNFNKPTINSLAKRTIQKRRQHKYS